MLALGGTGMLAAIMPFWPVSIIGSILGMMAPAVLLLLINLIYRLLRGVDGFGSGDYRLIAAVGAWLALLPLLQFSSFQRLLAPLLVSP